MTGEPDAPGSSLIPVPTSDLTRPSRDLVRRGLDSLLKGESRTIEFPSGFSLGTLRIYGEDSLLGDWRKPYWPSAPPLRVLRARGQVTIGGGEKALLDIDHGPPDLSPLRNLTSDALWGLVSTYSGPRKLTDGDMRHLASLTGLHYLSLWGWEITDAGLECLKGMAALRSLDIVSGRITGVGLAHLGGLASLKSLALSCRSLTDAATPFIAECAGLEHLSLTDVQITDAGLAYLGELEGLKSLTLSAGRYFKDRPSFTDDGIAHLAGLTNLKSIALSTRITNTGLSPISGLTGLEELSLFGLEITDAGLALITRLAGLKRLGLGFHEGSRISPRIDLGHLAALPGLEHLWLADCDFIDARVGGLGDLVNLKSLDVDGGRRLAEAGMAPFAGMRNLERLQMRGEPFTLGPLGSLTHLETLILIDPPITDVGLAPLSRLVKLTRLHIAFHIGIASPSFTDAGIAHLKGLTALKWLDLGGTQVTDAGLAHLSGLTALERLDLRETPITDAGLVQLKDLTSLRRLCLMGTKVTEAGRAFLLGLGNRDVQIAFE